MPTPDPDDAVEVPKSPPYVVHRPGEPDPELGVMERWIAAQSPRPAKPLAAPDMAGERVDKAPGPRGAPILPPSVEPASE